MNKHLSYDEYFDRYNKPTLIYKNYFEQNKEIDNLQSNWNSLRKWLLQLKNSYIEKDNIFDENKFRMILIVLDKINELERGDNM